MSWVAALSHEHDRHRTFEGRWKMLASSSVTPEGLAAAGFFYNPSSGSPDRCTCFVCGLSLVQWEADDNPILEHVKHAPKCAFARSASKLLLHPSAASLHPPQPSSSSPPPPAPQPRRVHSRTPTTPTAPAAHFLRDALLAPLAAGAAEPWHCDDIDLDVV